MAKQPAFPMYASDFYMDTGEWSVDEIGIYTRLLFSEWVNKDLPTEISRLARIAGCGTKKFQKGWTIIQKKVVLNGKGRFINPKMEEVRQQKLNYLKTQSEAGKKGVAAKKKKGSYPFNNPSSDPSSQKQAFPLPLQDNASSKEEAGTEPGSAKKKAGAHYSVKIAGEKVERIDTQCREILKKPWAKKLKVNPHALVQGSVGRHPDAIEYCLGELLKSGPGILEYQLEKNPKNPSVWPYWNKIIEIHSQNYNEREAMDAHRALMAQLKAIDEQRPTVIT